jgi:hypothetical protein
MPNSKYSDAHVRRLAVLTKEHGMAEARKQFNKEFKKAKLPSVGAGYQLLSNHGYTNGKSGGNGKTTIEDIIAEVVRMRDIELMSFPKIKEQLELKFKDWEIPHFTTLGKWYKTAKDEAGQPDTQEAKPNKRVSVEILARLPGGEIVLGRVSKKVVMGAVEQQLFGETGKYKPIVEKLFTGELKLT